MALDFAGANYTQDEYAASVNSPAITAFTFAAWIYVTAYGAAGGTIMVKDPASYVTALDIMSDGTLSGSAGAAATTGGINAMTPVTPGLGYAFDDTVHINGGSPDALGTIFTVGAGGAVTGLNPTMFGNGYSVGQLCTTTVVTGAGDNTLTVHVDSLTGNVNSGSVSNESIPLNAWTHVAMTWDVNGDGIVHLYIDGVECTYQAGQTSTGSADTSTGPFILGGDTFGFTADGLKMAEPVVYTRALSSIEIADLAASSMGAIGSPSSYWHMCANGPLTDATAGNTNPLTLSSPAPTVEAISSPGYNCGDVVMTVTFTDLGEQPVGDVPITEIGTILGDKSGV